MELAAGSRCRGFRGREKEYFGLTTETQRARRKPSVNQCKRRNMRAFGRHKRSRKCFSRIVFSVLSEPQW